MKNETNVKNATYSVDVLKDLSFIVQTDIQTCLLPRPKQEHRRIHFTISDKSSEEVRTRAELLASLIGAEVPGPGLWVTAYLYSDYVRQTILRDNLGYLAASFVAWEGNTIFVPAIMGIIGQEVVRPPWILKNELADFRRGFRSLMCPPDLALESWSSRRSLSANRPRSIAIQRIRSLFPYLQEDELEIAIREEIHLIIPEHSGDVDRFQVFFKNWLHDSSEESTKAEYFKDIGILGQCPDDSYRQFWFLAYGIFLRGLNTCTHKLYDRHPELRQNPYERAWNDSTDFYDDLGMFYIPHAKVLSSYIEIFLHLRNEFKDESPDQSGEFRQAARNFLARIGALDGDKFTEKLDSIPKWVKSKTNRLVRVELAGVEFDKVFPQKATDCTLSFMPETQSIADAILSFGFSPHNVVHYLAPDPFSCEGSPPIRRAVAWYSYQPVQTSKDTVLIFVSNIDESKMISEEEAHVRLLFAKNMFGPIGQLCMDIYGARKEVRKEQEREMLRAMPRVGHALDTPLSGILSLVKDIPDVIRQKKALDYQLNHLRQLIGFCRLACKRQRAELEPIKSNDFLRSLISALREICSICEDKSCSVLVKSAELVRGDYTSLFEAITGNLVAEIEEHSLEWNREQLYVAADGILTNALKNINEDCPVLKVSLDNRPDATSSGLFMLCENSTTFRCTELDKARIKTDELSNCSNVDWIGVTMLHLANEACGFAKPHWTPVRGAGEYADIVFYQARIQIAHKKKG